jgi:hypothetical protein
VSEWDAAAHRADVVILAAIRLELDAVLAVDAGAVSGSTWRSFRARADCRWRSWLRASVGRIVIAEKARNLNTHQRRLGAPDAYRPDR